jgi:hypothetical protein
MIPARIQENVNKEYRAVQNAEWEVKHEEAENKAKIIAGKLFPDYYQRKYLDSYKEGSEHGNENKHILKEMQSLTWKDINKARGGLKTRATW